MHFVLLIMVCASGIFSNCTGAFDALILVISIASLQSTITYHLFLITCFTNKSPLGAVVNRTQYYIHCCINPAISAITYIKNLYTMLFDLLFHVPYLQCTTNFSLLLRLNLTRYKNASRSSSSKGTPKSGQFMK